MEISRALFLAGAGPFLVLGAAHAWHTPTRTDETKGLSPRDPAVGEAMARTTPRLTDRTDLWKAWVGFNYTHSFGPVILFCFVMLIGRSEATWAANGSLAAPLALVIALVYLVLSAKYFFRTPTIGVAVSALCFAAATLLSAIGA